MPRPETESGVRPATLKALRLASGVSFAELSRRMIGRGVNAHPSTLWRWEHGRADIWPEAVKALAESLGVKVERLMGKARG